MPPPPTAIILAAGEGSRLRPYTMNKPKPMIRAANRPIAQYAVEALVANGIKDIVFVLGYHREKVQSYFGDGQKFGARISYAFQEALTGTTRALATAPRPEGSFLVLGGDNLVDASLIKRLLAAPGDVPAVVVHRSDDASRYGVVTLDGSQVVAMEEKPALPRSEWVNTGVYRFPQAWHERAKQAADEGLLGLPDLVQAAVEAGETVEGVKSTDLWSDAVYPWDLLRVHADLLRTAPESPPSFEGVHVDPGVLVGRDVWVGHASVLGAGTCIGNNVEIHPNCVLENCVVYDDVQIGPGTILRNTIVGAGSRLGPRVTALSGACDVRNADGWHHLDDFGSVIGEDVDVEGCATLLPGSVVGNRVRVAANRQVMGALEDGTHAV